MPYITVASCRNNSGCARLCTYRQLQSSGAVASNGIKRVECIDSTCCICIPMPDITIASRCEYNPRSVVGYCQMQGCQTIATSSVQSIEGIITTRLIDVPVPSEAITSCLYQGGGAGLIINRQL